MQPAPPTPDGVRKTFLRAGVAVLLGASAGAMSHQTAVWSGPSTPPGWRAVAADLPEHTVHGLAPRSAEWSLRKRELWYSRAALPGRGLRTLSLEAALPDDGLLDVWITRRTHEHPRPGDLLLRMRTAGEPSAQMFTWDDHGPQKVSCVPALTIDATQTHAVGIEAAEGLLDVTIDGHPSTCAAVAGPFPPALQSGWNSIRVSDLAIDGRPIPAPNPGPLPLWVFLGGFLSLGLSRLEQTSGAAALVSISGDLALVGSTAVALALAPSFPGGGAAIVMVPIALALFLRCCLHITRALRPLARRTDWTPTAAAAAMMPTVGLWLLTTARDAPFPITYGVLGGLLGTAAMLHALWRRPAPWRAFTLMAAVVSSAVLLARVSSSASLNAVFTGTLFGLAAASLTGLVSRSDRKPAARTASVLWSVGTGACAAVVLLANTVPPPERLHMSPDHRGGPIPRSAKPGVLVSGPLALGAPSRSRPALPNMLSASIPLHPIGDGSWGPAEVAAALERGPSATAPTAIILTVDQSIEPRPPSTILPWLPRLPGLLGAWMPIHSGRQTGQVRESLESLAHLVTPNPVLLVSGTNGPDAAPVRAFQSTFRQVADDFDHVTFVDFADRMERSPDEGWIDNKGVLTERAWAELSAVVLPKQESR